MSNKRAKISEEKILIYKQGVNVPKDVTKVIFDDSVTEVPDDEFEGCSKLNEVILNEGLQKMGKFVFKDCTSLESINTPSALTEITYGTFCNCEKLSEVVLNEGVRKIGEVAFYNCLALESIVLPSTVTEVVCHAFDKCKNLREILLNEGIQKIGAESIVSCSSFEVIKFPSISRRAKILIDAGYRQMEDKLTDYQHFEWRGGELLAPVRDISPDIPQFKHWMLHHPEAISRKNWKTTRRNLNKILAWISHYEELMEAATLLGLAMWKLKIEETGAASVEERSSCRGEVPGPVKDAINQYLEGNFDADDREESPDSGSSGDSEGSESDYSSHNSDNDSEGESLGDDW